MSSEPERRATRRFRISPGTFAYYALGSAVIRDASLGGIFIEERNRQPSPGTEIELELHLGDQVFFLGGTVRRCSQNGFAVEFAELPADIKERVARYFRSQSASFKP